MIPEEAYEKALARIRKAKKTRAVALDLSGLATLNRLPPELERLTSLQLLNLSGCRQLSGDLSPLARLTSLQSLDLSCCDQLKQPDAACAIDLSFLTKLTSLQVLHLSGCHKVSDFTEVAKLTALQRLDLSWCRQLSGDLSPLARLTSLQELNLSECRQLNGDLSPLTRLPSLQLLILSGCRQLSGDLSPLAHLTSLQLLVLYKCERLSGDLTPLARLTSLQELNLSECRQLSGDLTPLARLTSLQELNLSECRQLSGDLSPLARLISLQGLDLSGCLGVRRFASLESLLPRLKVLRLFGCKLDDLPPEVCGERDFRNVLDKVRAHYADLQYGARRDAELKVLFLGNGGVGKTQLCRRLRGLEFDPSVPSTHGVQLGEMTVTLESFPEPVRLNMWDFGGQDIYHGSHALFLQGQAVLLILWTPDLERPCSYQEKGVTLQHRPLSYWLDYVRAFAGIKGEVLVIQSKCDTRDIHILQPPAATDDFNSSRLAAVSAKTGLGLNLLKAIIEEAVQDCLNRRPLPPIGVGRVAVRDRLRQMLREDQELPPTQRRHCLLTREEFDKLCTNVGGVSDKDALLDFLLLNGVVFYRSGLFGERIVLDQNWALEAIYALFDREKILPLFRGYGRFTRKELEALIWAEYTRDQQQVFLDMMEGCGICFRLRKLPHAPTESDEKEEAEWEYLAPELLPNWSDAQEQLLGRLRDDFPDAEATARYAFLHEGILRGYLSKLGEHAKDAAIYWKYGCWFYEQKTRSQVLIETSWDDAESEAGSGTIRLRAWGERADHLVYKLLKTLESLPVGQPPEISLTPGKAGASSPASIFTRPIRDSQRGKAVPLSIITETRDEAADYLQISSRPELPPKSTPEIFVSFAWGDDSSVDARKRTEIVDRLCETLGQHGWNILRDSEVLRSGELISGFMKRIGLADHVIVVLSDKYLRSSYCMTELHYIYQRSLGEKEDFLRRIIPLTLKDAQISKWQDRAEHAKHWKKEFSQMKRHLSDLGTADFALYKSMQDWHNRIGDMLAYVNDKLHPHGFDEIVKDDFAALRQMLQRRR